jgi:hypothetical protein
MVMVTLIKEAFNEQRKKQTKTKCKEKTTAYPERKKTSKERKKLVRIKYMVPKVN